MATRHPQSFVIDASVVRAAGGEEASFPASKHCRDLLKAVLSICHRIVLTQEVMDEWKANWSRFGRKWLTSMYARKKVGWPSVAANPALRRAVQEALTDPGDADEALADMHLVEAALAVGARIASRDDRAKGLLKKAAGDVAALRTVIWVNPDTQAAEVEAWLLNGAPDDARLRLC